jgi:hypothetical protein
MRLSLEGKKIPAHMTRAINDDDENGKLLNSLCVAISSLCCSDAQWISSSCA